MPSLGFLRQLIERLHACEIPFMLCGSLGSSYYGQPRATIDIDLVVDPGVDSLERFIAELPDTLYVNREAALSALRARGMFNIIDQESGWKADLIVRKERPFSREEFSRRRTAVVDDLEVTICSPEDLILTKLEWCRHGESERQLTDVVGVLSIQGDTLDEVYLRRWAEDLRVTDLLERALAAARRAE